MTSTLPTVARLYTSEDGLEGSKAFGEKAETGLKGPVITQCGSAGPRR